MVDPDRRRALRVVAARSVAGAPTRAVSVPAAGERRFLADVSAERLTGLAVEAVVDDDLHLSDAGLDDLFVRHEDQLQLDLRLERLLIEAASALTRAGIAYRALKGPLLAHVAYDDPALRSFGDVDVLVPGAEFDRAVDALAGLGFARGFIEPRPGFDARFSKGAGLVRADGMELDLHRTLAPGAFGILLERTDLFARPARDFGLGAEEIAGLDRELAFVHACFHAALGNHPPRLVPLRDVAQLLLAGVDDTAVMALGSAARCEIVFQRAFDLVEAELGVPLRGALPSWARAHRPSRFDRWALRSYAQSDRSYAGQVTTSLWALPSLRERLAYARALVFPTRDYVRARERGYARRFARGLRVVKDSRPR